MAVWLQLSVALLGCACTWRSAAAFPSVLRLSAPAPLCGCAYVCAMVVALQGCVCVATAAGGQSFPQSVEGRKGGKEKKRKREEKRRLQLPRYWITEKLLPAMGHETRTPDMGHETTHETSHETGTPDIGHETAHETMANPKPMKPP